MADRYTDARRAVAEAIERWRYIADAGDGCPSVRSGSAAQLADVVVDAMTAAGWHPPRTCIQVDLTRLPTEAQAVAEPDDTEDVLDRMVAAGWMPKRWAPRAAVLDALTAGCAEPADVAVLEDGLCRRVWAAALRWWAESACRSPHPSTVADQIEAGTLTPWDGE
jgi:hypothetical protein